MSDRRTCRTSAKTVTSVFGTNRTSSDVRYSVAIGRRPDMAQTAQFGRE